MGMLCSKNKIQGDHSTNAAEEVFVTSAKDGDLVVPNANATGSIPESVQGDETNNKENDDGVSSGKSSEQTPAPQALDSISVDKEEEDIADINDGDSFAAKSEESIIRQQESSESINIYNALPVKNHDIYVFKTLQQQRNNYLEELAFQERVLVDFLFYREYEDVSRLSLDKYDRIVIEQNE
ncbi:DNA replication and repair protein RecF [Bienertia sinuspersici]